MKTFTFSILVLISSAAGLQAQDVGSNDSNQFKPSGASESSYYAKPSAIMVRANHVLDKVSSNRSEFAKIPVGNLAPPKVAPRSVAPVPTTGLRATILRTSAPKQGWKQEAALVSMNQPIAPKRFKKKPLRQDVDIIQAPPAAQEIIGRIGRPSPQNSSGFGASPQVQDIEIVSEPPMGFREADGFESSDGSTQYPRFSPRSENTRPEGVEIGPAIDFNDVPSFETLPAVEPMQDEMFSTQWEGVDHSATEETYSSPRGAYMTQWEQAEARSNPLDAAGVFDRVDSWQPEASKMQHRSDYFSPGGEPFAERTHQLGDPNFFGIDRRASCDEWANVAGCGGLKANPGHLGLPRLKSKDACDERTLLRFRRCECQSQAACTCQSSSP